MLRVGVSPLGVFLKESVMSTEQKPKKSRRELREQAFCLIFEFSFNQSLTPQEMYDNAVKIYGYEDDNYVSTVFYGVCASCSDLDAIISKYLSGWSIERLSHVSLSIMRLCLFEAVNVGDVPVKVALNEAVELAKKYDTDQAPAFINGVLNSAVKGEGIK